MRHTNKQKRFAFVLLGIIIAYAIIYSTVFYGGMSNFGDDNSYSGYAYWAVHGVFMQNNFDINSVRIMQILPIAFFYWIFNFNFYSEALWDILTYLGCIVMVFFIGKEIYNEYVGVLASLIFAFFPLMAYFSVTMGADTPMEFFIALAMLSLLYARKRHAYFWYSLSGISFMCGFMVDPLALLALLVAILYLLTEFFRHKLTRQEMITVTVGFIYGICLALLILIVYSYISTGEPFITVTETIHFFSPGEVVGQIVPANANLNYYLGIMFPYNLTNLLVSWFTNNNFQSAWNQTFVYNYSETGLFFYAVIIAIAYLIYKREGKAYFALFWFIVTFLILEFDPYKITIFPFTYLLQTRMERYLLTLGPALALIVAIAIADFTAAAKKKTRYVRYGIGAGILIILIATGMPVIIFWHNVIVYQEYDNHQIADYLSALPNNTRIYISSYMFVPAFMGYNNYSRFLIYDEVQNCSEISQGSYVVLPKYATVYNLSYTPNPGLDCPFWKLILYPSITGNYSEQVMGEGWFFQTKLYYVPYNQTS